MTAELGNELAAGGGTVSGDRTPAEMLGAPEKKSRPDHPVSHTYLHIDALRRYRHHTPTCFASVPAKGTSSSWPA